MVISCDVGLLALLVGLAFCLLCALMYLVYRGHDSVQRRRRHNKIAKREKARQLEEADMQAYVENTSVEDLRTFSMVLNRISTNGYTRSVDRLMALISQELKKRRNEQGSVF